MRVASRPRSQSNSSPAEPPGNWLHRGVDRWRNSSATERRAAGLRWAERAALAGVLIHALLFVGQYAWIAAVTVTYPDHLEWMEGGMVETIARVLEGKPIYGEPSLQYVPYLYTPLYHWVSAGVGGVIGVDFLACRLVSLLSVVGLAGLMLRWVQRETGSRYWAGVAVGLWCATYAASGKWFHLARVDTLGLLLLVAAMYGLRFYTGLRSAALCGFVLFLAFMTKQSALVAAAPVMLMMVVMDIRRGLLAGGLLCALFGLSIAIGEWATEGHWWFWIFELAGLHEDLPSKVVGYWRDDLWRIAVFFALAVVGVLSSARRGPRSAAFLFSVLLGATLMSYLSRMHSGGFDNVLMPVHYVAVLCAAVGGAQLTQGIGALERRRMGGSPTVVGLCLVLLFQLTALSYSVSACIPAPDAPALSQAYVAQLAAIDGEVLVPDRRWVQTRAGKQTFGLGMAARDVLRIAEPEHPARVALERELEQAVAAHRFAAVVISLPDSVPGLDAHYRPEKEIPSPWPVTGWYHRPWQVWVPKK